MFRMPTLKLIGYWRSGSEPEWPDPSALVDLAWDEQERHMVWTYVRSGTIARTYQGLSPCRFCGEHKGSIEFTDGVYIWPQGLAHYIDAHRVRLPEPFVRHAVARLDELEAAPIDYERWRSIARD
jgi:hypothetical protein